LSAGSKRGGAKMAGGWELSRGWGNGIQTGKTKGRSRKKKKIPG